MSELGRVNSCLFGEAPFGIKKDRFGLFTAIMINMHTRTRAAAGLRGWEWQMHVCVCVCVCVCVVLTSGCGPQGEGSDAEGGHHTHHQVTDR